MTTKTTNTAQINPSTTANPINKLFFWWTLELFKKGARGSLRKEDLYSPLPTDESEHLANRLEEAWHAEMKRSKVGIDEKARNCDEDRKNLIKPSLTKAIFRTFWLKHFYIGILLLFQTAVLRTLQPLLQGWIISYFDSVNDNENTTSRNDAIIYTVGLVITVLGITFIMHHMNLASQRVGMQIRVACCSLIYRKSLKLSRQSLNKTAAGQMVNLLSNDVNRFDQLPMFFNFLWIMPIQIIVVGYVMWRTIGLSTFVGIISLLILAVPIQSYISKVSGKLRAMIAQRTDRRVQLMNELISGIQTIKMYAWEKPFNEIVSQTRLLELNLIKHSSYLRGLYLSLMVFTERTTLFITVVVYIFMGNTITAQVTFALAGYFNILQMIAIVFFPQALILCGEAAISIDRIRGFLLLEEISIDTAGGLVNMKSSQELKVKSTQTTLGPVSIELERVSACWDVGHLPPTLCEVSLKIKGGQLCSIIGPVGSGKSSLFNVLLQELPLGAGTIKLLQSHNKQHSTTPNNCRYVKDNPQLTISYASQDPWLFSGTIRENILFGQIYEQVRYREVAKVCSLLHDFKQFPNSDLTVVGDRGTSLSGGQKARINLARAVYQRADLYLLDDPLSAVDSRVARHLFENCIIRYLRGKTRILITHQLHFLKEADIIAVMERGFIKEQGTFDSLRETSDGFNDMLNQLEETDNEATLVTENDADDELNIEGRNLLIKQNKILKRNASLQNSRRISVKSFDSHTSMFVDDSDADVETEGEAIATGQLSRQIYIRYISNGGGIISLIFLMLNFLLSQVVISGGDYWLAYWTNLESVRTCLHDSANQCQLLGEDYDSRVNDTFMGFDSLLDEDGLLPTNYAIYIYTILIIGCIVLSISRSFFFMNVCMNAGKKLHNEMFFNIIHATMLFFNTNPSGKNQLSLGVVEKNTEIGRVLNRFSKDVGAMDELLPKAALEALQIFLVLMGIIIIVIIVNPWMVLPIIIIGIIFYIIQIYFLNTVRDIERLEGIAKSPVFSHVSATLNGLTTIRSRNADVQRMLCRQFDQYQDNHTGAWYLSIATASAFGFALDLMSCIFISCVCFSFILMDRENTFGGSVGLAISQSLILTGMVQYGVKQATDVQSQMTAVERIIQYTDLPKERSAKSSPSLPENWITSGRIQMKRVFLSYKEGDPPVLKNIDLTLKGGWKVGVVGRTGAGKSSIIAALFRLVEDGLQGEILIDGRDTKSIGLDDLRANISIIPQQPVLFSETLRYNLDPFSKYPDDILYDVLKEVELNDTSLDQWINEGGTNFSVGQRQLICLARAILRNNRIIILDEATANIDSSTDALIQRTIRTKFSNCTVITVAHRLNTIIDSDKVVVMEDGRVVEFDEPYLLLYGNPDGCFYRMIEHMGEFMAKKLHEDARAHHELRLSSRDGNVTVTQNINGTNQNSFDSSSI